MKRYRTRTWSGVLLTLVMASLLYSCTKEPIDGEKHPDDELPAGMICIDFSGSESLRFGASAYTNQSDEEMMIAEVQILFYDLSDGTLYYRCSTGESDVHLLDSKILVPNSTLSNSTKYRVWVVANAGDNTSDLDIGSSMDELTERLTQIKRIDNLKPPLLMSGYDDYQIAVDDSRVYINLVRQVVKLNVAVKLSEGFIERYPDLEFGGITNNPRVPGADISLFKLPSHSFMLDRSEPDLVLPQDSEMLKSEDNALPFYIDRGLTWRFSAYAYENPVRGDDVTAKESSTQFILQLPYIQTTSHNVVEDNYYKVYIKNLGIGVADPHKTVRNHVYDIRVTINGFGSDTPDYPDGLNMTVTTEVLPWGVVEKDPEVGGYVKFVTSEFKKTGETTETTLQSGDNLPENGGTVKIYCETNVGGWYVIVRDHGKIVQNTKSTPTPIVRATNEQSIEIAIPELDYLDGRYTVSIHHPLYASELINQIPPITFTQYGGFIPTSELLKGVTIDEKLEKWPEKLLPPRGLQIAKKGNVLPSAQSELSDPIIIWSDVFENTRTLSPALGSGKRSYEILRNSDLVHYPIGQACKHLGREWYVPSRDELRLIYTHRATFASSYLFTHYYWTCSEYSADKTWLVDFTDGYMGEYSKDQSNMKVRCVRNI